MSAPLMPKATALWLIENSTLTFEQIADFCGLHIVEIQAIADGEISSSLTPFDPILNGQLTLEEINRCEKDSTARLVLSALPAVMEKKLKKGGHYTPVSLRKDRPNGIAWMLKNYPEVSDAAVCRLLGTTKATLDAVRNKTHWNSPNIKPGNPVTLGLCSQKALDETLVAAGIKKTS